MKRIILIVAIFTIAITAREVIPTSKTMFTLVSDNGHEKELNLKGKEFIVVSVRERGSDGRFYAVDKDGVVVWCCYIRC